jgi:hypothetical protein
MKSKSTMMLCDECAQLYADAQTHTSLSSAARHGQLLHPIHYRFHIFQTQLEFQSWSDQWASRVRSMLDLSVEV